MEYCAMKLVLHDSLNEKSSVERLFQLDHVHSRVNSPELKKFLCRH